MSELAGARFEQLVGIMRTLRSPEGCAWDRQQTVRTLRPFVLEETYELLDALDRGDYDALEAELGDFLFEAVFLAQICEEEGRFSIADSITGGVGQADSPASPRVRHGRQPPRSTRAQVKEQWEDIKAKERKDAPARDKTVLSGVPRSMPSLLRAYELSTRAATVGFDWVKAEDVLDKIDEEARELRKRSRSRARRRPKRKKSSAICCSRSPTSRGRWASSPRRRCESRTTSFSGGSMMSSGRSRQSGQRLRDLTLEQLEAHWTTAKETTKNTK